MSTDAYVGAYNTYIGMYVYHITPIYLRICNAHMHTTTVLCMYV